MVPILGDFNGDGRTDFLFHDGGSATGGILNATSFTECLSTGTGLSCTPAPQSAPSGADVLVADVNGDGMADTIEYGSGSSWVVCLSTGPTFKCAQWTGHSGGISNNIIGDFNGDGMADIATNLGGGQWEVCLSTGTSFSCSTWTGLSEMPPNVWAADLNGDGKSDLLAYSATPGMWDVCLSKGVGFSCSQWPGHSGGTTNNLVADFNGDGRADIATYNGSSSTWTIWLSTGTTFAPSTATSNGPPYGPPTNKVFVGDFNGDGAVDLLAGSASAAALSESGWSMPDQLSSISTGLGAQTTITYGSLASTANYTASLAGQLSYPKSVLRAGLSVVTGVSGSLGATAPTGASAAYYYDSAVASADGRGFLGFNTTENVDTTAGGTGLRAQTTYNLNWPWIGSPTKVQTFFAGGALQSETDGSNFVGLIPTVTPPATPMPEAECVAGSSCIAWAQTAIKQSYEYSGTSGAQGVALPAEETDTVLDANGNPFYIAITVPPTAPVVPGGSAFGNGGAAWTVPATGTVWAKETRNDFSDVIVTATSQNIVGSTTYPLWQLGRLHQATVTSTIPDGTGSTLAAAP
ncbi:MAG: VCBS repeat-containing protein, partial [Acidobacteriota bacterium]|nr:VCBS repeat-containing protein [Acidobacteriota bacterium]